MNNTFKNYVTNIVDQTDSSPEIKADLFEELMTHLEESYEVLVNEGFTQKEAEKEVLRSFGDEDEIGNDIRKAMYPYQKELLGVLAVTSLIYSFLIYLFQLFNEGDAHIWWLIISVSISSVLLFLMLKRNRIEKKRWRNTLLVIYLVIYFFGGLGLALGLNHKLAIIFVIYCILIVLLALILIYLNVIFHWEMSKLKKGFHLFNMSTGLLIIGANLFVIWAILLFSDGLTGRAFLLFLPIFSWLLAYIIQILFVRQGLIKSAVIFALIPALLVGSIVIFRVMMFSL